MLDACRRARELANARDRRDLDQDWMAALALERLLEIIGEGARRLSAERRDAHPDVPWSQIVGMRDRLAHGYDQVDLDRLWVVVDQDLPKLIADLERMIGQP
jgi:uncharacterized protein with HEPN domain